MTCSSTIYPPYELLNQVLDRCPKAGLIYLKLWKEKDEDGKVYFTKQTVVDDLLINWKKFRNDLKLLKKERLISLSFNQSQEKVTIQMINSPSQDSVAA